MLYCRGNSWEYTGLLIFYICNSDYALKKLKPITIQYVLVVNFKIAFVNIYSRSNELGVHDTVSKLLIKQITLLEYNSCFKRCNTRKARSGSYYSKQIFQKYVISLDYLLDLSDVSSVLNKILHFPMRNIVLNTLLNNLGIVYFPIFKYIWISFYFTAY